MPSELTEKLKHFEAALAAEEFPGDIQLLMTDVILPGMNGHKLAETLKERHPDMLVLF